MTENEKKHQTFMNDLMNWIDRKVTNKSVVGKHINKTHGKKKIFHKAQKAVLKTAIFAVIAAGGYKGIRTVIKNQIKYEQTSYLPNEKYSKYRKYEDKFMGPLAFVEKFSNRNYDCGSRQTYGYGSTYDLNGNRVTKDTPAIDKTLSKEFLASINPNKTYQQNIKQGMFVRGKEIVISHLNDKIYPFLDLYLKEDVRNDMLDHEMVALMMFMYNNNPQKVTGYNLKGEKVGETAKVFEAINNRESKEDIAKKFTGFRSTQGKFSKGILKLRWVTAVVYLNPTIKDVDKDGKEKILGDFMSLIPKLKPGGLYDEKDMSFYYEEKMGSVGQNDYYTPKLDNETMLKFIKNNIRDSYNVASILDEETLNKYSTSSEKKIKDLSLVFKSRENKR